MQSKLKGIFQVKAGSPFLLIFGKFTFWLFSDLTLKQKFKSVDTTDESAVPPLELKEKISVCPPPSINRCV